MRKLLLLGLVCSVALVATSTSLPVEAQEPGEIVGQMPVFDPMRGAPPPKAAGGYWELFLSVYDDDEANSSFLYAWDLATGAVRFVNEMKAGRVNGVAFAKNGTLYGIGDDRNDQAWLLKIDPTNANVTWFRRLSVDDLYNGLAIKGNAKIVTTTDDDGNLNLVRKSGTITEIGDGAGSNGNAIFRHGNKIQTLRSDPARSIRSITGGPILRTLPLLLDQEFYSRGVRGGDEAPIAADKCGRTVIVFVNLSYTGGSADVGTKTVNGSRVDWLSSFFSLHVEGAACRWVAQ